MALQAILEKFTFYRQAGPAFQAEVRAEAKVVTVERGLHFFRAGEVCPQFALVGAGSIRVFKTSESGREITLYHVTEGQTCLVNMLAAFTGARAPASALIEEPVEAAVVTSVKFREWLRTVPAMQDYVFGAVAGRVLDVMTLMEEVALNKMDQRLAELLLHRFTDGVLKKRVISVTHEEIASDLGTAREVVSRLLKEAERLGAISLGRGRIELCDETALRAWSAIPRKLR